MKNTKIRGLSTLVLLTSLAPWPAAAAETKEQIRARSATPSWEGEAPAEPVVVRGSAGASPSRSVDNRGLDKAAVAMDSTYKDWKSVALTNGLIELQVVPEIGGRVIQFKFGRKEFFWVNPQLTGKQPPPGGLGPEGAWLNYGGDKLWPAPQGWDNDQQWPGPPDAVLDGSPYAIETRPNRASIQLTSGDDPRSGIRFSRAIRIFPDSTRVSLDATMTNIDTKPRRWGIWAHTQLDGGKAGGPGHNSFLHAWCRINRKSQFPQGYRVLFGAEDNPSFQTDQERGLLHVQYRYQVGKIGLDSTAGWVATVDGITGAVFVQRFKFELGGEYPDGSSVEFWLNGVGKFRAYNKDSETKADPVENPYVFESEILSPFTRLQPGESYTWHYDWYATQIGGNYPVVNCTAAGVTAEPLVARAAPGRVSLSGRWGVFSPGNVRARLTDFADDTLRTIDLAAGVTPLKPVTIQATVDAPAGLVGAVLELTDKAGKVVGELARASVPIVEIWLAPPEEKKVSAPR
jgi:Domain of unknown function (DUF4380)